MTQRRIMMVVTHLMGSGHLVRTRAIAAALARKGAIVRVISGGRPLAYLGQPPVPEIELPPVTIQGLDYSRLITPSGHMATPAWMADRKATLLRMLHDFQPDTVVTETWPFGRGSLREEFTALTTAARALPRPARLIASIRDIPEPPLPKKIMRARDALKDYARIVVHGDAALVPFSRIWPVTSEEAEKIFHTGYVATPSTEVIPNDDVLVSVGSGMIGRPLLDLAARAARISRRPWRLRVGGADADAAISALPSGPAITEPARGDFRARLGGAACSVSLCGYHTATDLLACATPAVVVPMQEGDEQEQILRAKALSSHGFVVRQIESLTSADLENAVEGAIAEGPRAPTSIALDGAEGAAKAILDVVS